MEKVSWSECFRYSSSSKVAGGGGEGGKCSLNSKEEINHLAKTVKWEANIV